MKCSLLALSCYLDDELEASRKGEVEAHLVGCARCRGGLEHLTEETKRISALAPAHVPDHSVHALLSQLNLIGPDDPLPERASVELHGWSQPGGPDSQPWQWDGQQAPPLSARRDDYLRRRSAAAREAGGDGDGDSGDQTADGSAGDPSGVALGTADNRSVPRARADVGMLPSHAPAQPTVTPSIATLAPRAPQAPPGDPSVSSTWPSPSGAEPHPPPPPDLDQPLVAVHDEWEDSLDEEQTVPRAAPRRAVRPGLLGRARERMAMYRALSRGPVDDFDDSVQVVSGTGAPLRSAPPRAVRRAAGGVPAADAAAAAGLPGTQPQALRSADLAGTSQEAERWLRPGRGGTGLGALPPGQAAPPLAPPLPGLAFPPSPPPAWGTTPRPWVEPPPRPPQRPPAPIERDLASPPPSGRIPGWGDAVTSVPPSSPGELDWTPSVDYPAPQRTTAVLRDARRSGRVRTEGVPGAGSRLAVPAAVAGLGRHAARLRGQAPRRLLVGLAGVAVLTLIGLVTGRSVQPAGGRSPVVAQRSAPVARPPHSSGEPVIAVPANPSAAAPSASAPPSASASATPSAAAATTAGLTDPHLLGSGAAGYALHGIRYGAHPGSYRVVFDLSAADSTAGTPRAVVGSRDAQTIWVELFGVSAGPISQPVGAVVSRVALLPRDTVPGATVYALTLAHPATVSAAYVTGPVRLVLDLH